MRRTAFSLVACLTVLLLTSAALGQQAERGNRPRPIREPAPQRPAARQQQLAQRLRRQINELKTKHEELIGQLRTIRATADEEGAAKTVQQIERLIAQRQQTFQESIRTLEQQQQRLMRAARQRAGRVERTRRRPAPDFELDSFKGKNVKLSDYRGKIVVLEWLNPECPFSRYHHETTQTMADLAEKYKSKDVVWFAVDSTSHAKAQDVRAFAEKNKVPYPILDDRSGNVGRAYGARSTPHMFIIDKDGAIAYNGAIDTAPLGKVSGDGGKINYVDKALSELLAGEKVTSPTTPPYGCSVKYASP